MASGGPSGDELLFLLAAAAAVALVVLAGSLWLAARAKRKPAPRPPKKTFEHGRRLARERAPLDVDAALAALRASPVGAPVQVSADERRGEVVLERKRSQPCAQAAGYVAGVFESAWAHDVVVHHPQCAGDNGGPCRYAVSRAAIAPGPRVAAAPTRGSQGGKRRWLPIRRGGSSRGSRAP